MGWAIAFIVGIGLAIAGRKSSSQDGGGELASKAPLNVGIQTAYETLKKTFPYGGEKGRDAWVKSGERDKWVWQAVQAVARVAPEFGLTNENVPSFIVAHAALSSGWARSVMTQLTKNCFGIKVGKSWTGPFLETMTTEYKQPGNIPYQESARWRYYKDWEGCIRDHLKLVSGLSRYKKSFEMLKNGNIDYMSQLGKDGWYTDADGSVAADWKAILKTVRSIIAARQKLQG